MSYAEDTKVPVERSRAEIETMLQRYGCSQFVSGWKDETAVIGFTAHDRQVRFVLPLPKMEDFRVGPPRTMNGRNYAPLRRNDIDTRRAFEQELRRRWRALALCIKAKLESVESKIESFEDAFLAQITLPDGSTFGAWARGAIADVYSTGRALPAHVDEDKPE